MKTIKILAALVFITNATFAGGGWASSAVRLSVNGAATYQYLLNDEGWADGSWASNTAFNLYNFGTPTSLVLNGGDGDAWTDDTPGYTTASFILYYRVYKTGNASGGWNQVALNTLTDNNGNDYVFSKTNANINILALALSGTGAYTLEVVMSKDQLYVGGNWNTMVPGGQAEAYNSATSGYKATFNFTSLPVELTGFGVRQLGSAISLEWKTATETNNYGFDVERSDKSQRTWMKIGFVEGHGSTNNPHSYSFTDESASGEFAYRLKQIDRDGKFEYSKEVEVTAVAAPTVFALSQNYPNPFNPSTNISFTVPITGRATLKILNILGEEVATLFDDEAQTGKFNKVQFNASGLASGMYFSRLEQNGKVQMTKMTLIK
jgi:hypothetical protein